MLTISLLLVNIVIDARRQQPPLSVKVERSVNYTCLLRKNDGSFFDAACAANAAGGLFQSMLLVSNRLFFSRREAERCQEDVSKQLSEISV